MTSELKISLTPAAMAAIGQILIITEDEKIRRAIKMDNVFDTLLEYDQYLRNEIKYRNRWELQEVRDKLYEIMNKNEISI